MKVLITGMDGFIGNEISRRLRSSGWDVVGFSNGPAAGKSPSLYKGSVTDPDALRTVFGRERPNACVHLAGLAHATVSREDMEMVRQVNVEGALNTARAAAESGVTQFVFFSSAKVYGDKTPASGCDEDDEPKPAGIYAELKYEAEQALLHIAGKGDMGVVVVRPVAVLGRGDTKGNYARLIRAVRKGVFPLIGGGRARRSIAYLDRVAERIDRILGPAFVSGKTYVFSDGAFELREILESVRRATGYAFFPYVPVCVAETGGGLLDWVQQSTTGKEGHAKEALGRLIDHFVIRAHHYDSDFGPIGPFDLDLAMEAACALEHPSAK
jgi:nucleoside-diphosphate-sugar epimerase